VEQSSAQHFPLFFITLKIGFGVMGFERSQTMTRADAPRKDHDPLCRAKFQEWETGPCLDCELIKRVRADERRIHKHCRRVAH
jgi:hypothetical protein